MRGAHTLTTLSTLAGLSVKTRFTDVLVGQTLVVSALAPLYSRDPMILCVAKALPSMCQLLKPLVQ